MDLSIKKKGPFSADFIKDYRWFIHTTAVGLYMLLTVGVLYTCMFVAYPHLYKDDGKIVSNSIYLSFILFNMMGNFFLGSVTDSSFKSGCVLPEPPRTWMFCVPCNQHTPPRSHHCSVCEACTLKQDHHCFFLSQCVGVRNQKYFIPYTLYVALGSLHAIKTLLLYLGSTYVKLEFSAYCIGSYLFPGPLYNWWMGYGDVTLIKLVCLVVLYGCFSTGWGCFFLFVAEMFLVGFGQTPYEFFKGDSRYNRGVWSNYAGVFGNWWFINFLVPMPNKAKDEKSQWGQPTFFKSI